MHKTADRKQGVMIDMATLYLVDDDTLFESQVASLTRRLGIGFQPFLTGEQCLGHGVPNGPACLVTDFHLLGMSGLQLQHRLSQQGNPVPVIFVVRQPDTSLTVRAMQQGAVTVLDKPVDEAMFQRVIMAAIEKSQSTRRIDRPHIDLSYRVSELTLKEQDVLNLILQGAPNKAIARQLGVSLRTIEVRRQNIFRKTKTRSVAELVRCVLERRER
jgi:FixJ family two-component response regulator